MAKNEFLPFGTAEGANVLSNQEYEALAARHNGFNSGVAKSKELNKVWRQASLIASAVAQFIVDTDQKDLLDTGDVADIKSRLASVINLIISNGDYVTNPYLKLELLKKIDKADIAQQLGNDPNKVGSLLLLTEQLGKKASVADVNGKMAKDQNGADIPDKPKFIENLGLGELTKRFVILNSAESQVRSGNGKRFIYVNDDGRFGVAGETGSGWGVNKDGVMNGVMVPVACGGTGGKTAGEAIKNLGIDLMIVPVGASVIWNSAAPIPDNFWPNEGRSFSATDYPELAKVFPSLKLPDDRGYAIRIADNGKGIDSGRTVGSFQEDAIRNFTGWFGERDFRSPNTSDYFSFLWGQTGVFKLEKRSSSEGASPVMEKASAGNWSGTKFDPSLVVPTANENRMKNVAKILITRVK